MEKQKRKEFVKSKWTNWNKWRGKSNKKITLGVYLDILYRWRE